MHFIQSLRVTGTQFGVGEGILRVFAHSTSGCQPHMAQGFPWALQGQTPSLRLCKMRAVITPLLLRSSRPAPSSPRAMGRLHFPFDPLARGRKEGLTGQPFAVCLVGTKMLWEVAESSPHLNREAIHPHPVLLLGGARLCCRQVTVTE